jgi:hypothetical protein
VPFAIHQLHVMHRPSFDRLRVITAIAINQAWYGRPGSLIKTAGSTFNATVFHGASNDIKDPPSKLPSWQVWAKPMARSNSSMAVLIANYHPTAQQSGNLSVSELGMPDKVTAVRDVSTQAICRCL